MDRVSVTRSPKVADLSWGSVTVEGEGSFRDAKCWPGGAREWDWNETGTGHTPGIQVADVDELIEHGSEIVVLSRGQDRRLQVQDETLAWLEAQGVDTEVLESNAAVERYNELSEAGEAVGLLLHSTC